MKTAFSLAMALMAAVSAADSPMAENWAFVDKYCDKCHNATDWAGGLAFDTLNRDGVAGDTKVWEEAVRKLRGALMPPPGEEVPGHEARMTMVHSLETVLDKNAKDTDSIQSVGLHRLNRREYANAIRELLDLEVKPEAMLPRDDQSSGFDNVADVLKVSPSFLEQYLSAARTVSVLALGNPNARAQGSSYPGTPDSGQYVHIPGLPLGTRGGMLIKHQFPVDGEYTLTVNGLAGGGYLWGVMDPELLLVTVDGKRVFAAQIGGEEDLKAIDVEQAVGLGRINDRFTGIKLHVVAGVHDVGVTYRQKTAAESNEVLHTFIPVTGMQQMVNGNSTGPRISSVEIKGPVNKSGISQTPSRARLFVCKPATAADEPVCAKQILSTLARGAFRRPVTDADIAGAMTFFEAGRQAGGFDSGIQKGVMAILSSPKFLFRFHTPPASTQPGEVFRINDLDLASRLSFFLWSAPPDTLLMADAVAGKLHEPAVLEGQVRRMLADARAHTLATNFAYQWLNLQGVELINPDTNIFPDYTEDLVTGLTEEMQQFVWSILGENRSVIDLLTDNHTFINERLAMHYGIKGVRGSAFRKVTLQDSTRFGLLGKGAFLMGTSYANRTTPVLRGAYILEHFMGTPPTAPPPNISAFPESQEGGEQLTVRARMEAHRKMKSCHGCHGVIDPLGLALENFNAIGQWRSKDIDAGTVIDAAGQLADGTPLKGPDDLRTALVSRPDLFVQTFAENLLTYALGRSATHDDMPLVRKIMRDSAPQNYRFFDLVLGIVRSAAFQFDRVPDVPKVKPALTAALQTTSVH
jgi:Protein of unknown function (DUF1592)/Protein of unknown function (DUF1588)/Protein of unknown function (DUF1587)/Protein of unknown function (DUF1585)/Protein of unknown function (DUF1595)